MSRDKKDDIFDRHKRSAMNVKYTDKTKNYDLNVENNANI